MSIFRPIPLNLPPAPLKLTQADGKVWVFDVLRKKNLICTPEEWVRQHWIHYLATCKGIPKNLMKTEDGIQLNGLSKRSDLLVYNKSGQQILLAEFKRPDVRIQQQVFDQISRYNSHYKIPYLVISNGLTHYYCKINQKDSTYTFLEDLPEFNKLTTKD